MPYVWAANALRATDNGQGNRSPPHAATQGYPQGYHHTVGWFGSATPAYPRRGASVTITAAAPGRTTTLITAQLNTEWTAMAHRPPPARWNIAALAACASLSEALDVLTHARRSRPETADTILIGLLDRHIVARDALAGRLVLQAMLGRAVNLARRAHRPGASGVRGDIDQLTAAAVAALWNGIATYPVQRRTRKVAVNLCMDALGAFTSALDDRAPTVADDHILQSGDALFVQHTPTPATELLTTLAWGVDTGAISPDDASLLSRVYCPAPGDEGGALAVARELGLRPATVRQRCLRSTRRLASAVRERQTYP